MGRVLKFNWIFFSLLFGSKGMANKIIQKLSEMNGAPDKREKIY